MKEPEGLFQKEIDTAFSEWDRALEKDAPARPIGPDYKSMWKAMAKDPRVAQKVLEMRRFQHQVDGADPKTAQNQAVQDMEKFRTTFGSD